MDGGKFEVKLVPDEAGLFILLNIADSGRHICGRHTCSWRGACSSCVHGLHQEHVVYKVFWFHNARQLRVHFTWRLYNVPDSRAYFHWFADQF